MIDAAVRDSLEAGGELGRIKAEMRSEVMKLLDGTSASNRVKRPESPRDVVILNELIREYLDWIGYKYTLNVLISGEFFIIFKLNFKLVFQTQFQTIFPNAIV